MTKIGDSSTSPNTPGTCSSSRSYHQITQIRRPDGTSASIRKEPLISRPWQLRTLPGKLVMG